MRDEEGREWRGEGGGRGGGGGGEGEEGWRGKMLISKIPYRQRYRYKFLQVLAKSQNLIPTNHTYI